MVVTISRFSGSLTGSWKYIDFAVSVISHSHLPSTGSSMSILFCRFMGMYDSSLRLSAGKSSTSASKWTSDTTLLSKLSSGFSPRLSLFVSANVVVVKRINAYSFQSVHVPPIQAILNSEVTTSSERIFLFARNLAHTDASSKFKFDFSAAESSLWISDSSVFCHFSNGFRIQSRVLVTLGQLRSFSVGMFSNNVDWTQSQISDLPTTGSFRMTVKSSKFGVFQSSITNRFGFSAAISMDFRFDDDVENSMWHRAKEFSETVTTSKWPFLRKNKFFVCESQCCCGFNQFINFRIIC